MMEGKNWRRRRRDVAEVQEQVGLTAQRLLRILKLLVGPEPAAFALQTARSRF
jgi:hypothetical protein